MMIAPRQQRTLLVAVPARLRGRVRRHPPGVATALACCLLACTGASAAGEAFIGQYGHSAAASIEQIATTGSVRVEQSGSANRADVSQVNAMASSVVTQQSGSGNSLSALQSGGGLDGVEIHQPGLLNTARVEQSSAGLASSNEAVVRQEGRGGASDLTQAAAHLALAVVDQSPLGDGNAARIFQSGPGPVAVIAQGVAVKWPLPDARMVASLARSGALQAAASLDALASIRQAGEAGLAASIVQAGAGPSASISQSGAFLEAEILQTGGAHTAAITQSAYGSPPAPYRASVWQSGTRPHSISVEQSSPNAPRSIQVIQR